MLNPIPTVASIPVVLAFFNLMRDPAVIYSGSSLVAVNKAARTKFGTKVSSAKDMPPASESYCFKIGATSYEARVYQT